MEKFLKILKNYYIVFSICAICVALVGVIYGMKFYNQAELKKTALAPPPVYLNNEAEVSKTEVEIKKEPPAKKTSVKKEEPIKETMAIPETKNFKIGMPVDSREIIKDFSDKELVYSNTFDDYRVHTGTDIKCKRSEAVFSVADGTVENVYKDYMEGIVIEINHDNGFKSIYKNLSADKMVKKGERVTKGQVISGVGETAMFESNDENHLHFELKKEDKFVNPVDYFE